MFIFLIAGSPENVHLQHLFLFLKVEQMGGRGRKEGSNKNRSSGLRSAAGLETDVSYPTK